MPTFQYAARSADGQQKKGVLKAGSEAEAASSLRGQNLTVVSLTAVAEKKKGGGGLFGGPPRPNVSSEDIAIFTRQLSTMIGAGIPLLEGLEILSDQAEDKGFKIALTEVVESVRGGSDLSESLGLYPKLFPRIYVSMIKAGEASGQLDGILSRLAEFQEASESLKREIKSAMTYPVISLGLIVMIVVGLMVGVVPKFKEIFTSLGIDLPLPTRILLATSDFMTQKWYILLGGVVALIVALKIYKGTKTGARQWDWLMLHLPVFGQLFLKVAVARFARTFSTLTKSGVPILGALEIVGATSGNSLIEDAVLMARDSVRKGEPLAAPLAKSPVFPLMVVKMIAIGERSGALETLLEKISEFFDQQVKATVEALTSLIEPLMIGVMGALVGGIVIAIFLPIIKIQEAVRKK